MSAGGVAGFWSYSHQDDERDGHALTRLAAHIKDEFALVTGETLTLFLDRNDIRWGDEWRRRIEAALAETTFFIPLITPLYFKRPECRRELLTFVGQAQSLGAVELVMPILYVGIPGLTEENGDEAIALIARMQYVDWREIRLCSEDSPEYRRGVNSFAMRLAEVCSHYEQSASKRTDESMSDIDDIDDIDKDGVLDLLGDLDSKLPAWKTEFDDTTTLLAQLMGMTESYLGRLSKFDRPGAPMLNVLRSMALEIEPLVRRLIERCESYSSLTIQLDPVVLTLLRELITFPELSAGASPLLSPIRDAYREIKRDERYRNDAMEEAFQRYRSLSKDMARVVRLVEVARTYWRDAASLVKNWHEEMDKDAGLAES